MAMFNSKQVKLPEDICFKVHSPYCRQQFSGCNILQGMSPGFTSVSSVCRRTLGFSIAAQTKHRHDYVYICICMCICRYLFIFVRKKIVGLNIYIYTYIYHIPYNSPPTWQEFAFLSPPSCLADFADPSSDGRRSTELDFFLKDGTNENHGVKHVTIK